MKKIVTKFGGSSLADAEQFAKVRRILSWTRPGGMWCPLRPDAALRMTKRSPTSFTAAITRRPRGRITRIPLTKLPPATWILPRSCTWGWTWARPWTSVNEGIGAGASADWCASRGEYLSGLLLADYLGWRFLDPVQGIFFDQSGRFDAERTQVTLSALLADGEPTVIPGFFGSMPDGQVHTFSRGGSDVTGSIVARAVGADMYENWTDVSGFLTADPRVVENPREIRSIPTRSCGS